jgi:hypothetical protein
MAIGALTKLWLLRHAPPGKHSAAVAEVFVGGMVAGAAVRVVNDPAHALLIGAALAWLGHIGGELSGRAIDGLRVRLDDRSWRRANPK